MSVMNRLYGLGWAVLGSAVLAHSVVDGDPVRRGVAMGAVLGGALLGSVVADRRAAAEQQRLEEVGLRARRDLAAVARQRDVFARRLVRLERLRDPIAEARRARIDAVPELHVELRVAAGRSEARLRDLGADHVVVAVPSGLSRRLVPGVPVQLRIEAGAEVFGPVCALAAAPCPSEHQDEWMLRFPRPFALDVLPQALRDAIGGRERPRVRPPRDLPASVTLIGPGGPIPARVADLSEDGIGLVVAIDDHRLADLDGELGVQLTFPTLGRFAVLVGRLRNASALGDDMRLGLSFDAGQERGRAMIREWITACAVAANPPLRAQGRQDVLAI